MKIKIIARPSGEAPGWVRDAWIDLELDDVKRDLPTNGDCYRGVLGGRPSQDNLGGYRVNGLQAVMALADKDPTAAQWWKDNAPAVLWGSLVFGAKFCEVIER